MFAILRADLSRVLRDVENRHSPENRDQGYAQGFLIRVPRQFTFLQGPIDERAEEADHAFRRTVLDARVPGEAEQSFRLRNRQELGRGLAPGLPTEDLGHETWVLSTPAGPPASSDPGGRDAAVAELIAWEERAWRGIQLELHVDADWRGSVRVPAHVRWYDEPRLSDGRHLYPLDLDAGAIGLSDLPPGKTLRLFLPVDPHRAGILEVRVATGDLEIHHGAHVTRLAPGERRRLELGRIPEAAPQPGPSGAAAWMTLRVRPFEGSGPVELDPKSRERLERLGYTGVE